MRNKLSLQTDPLVLSAEGRLFRPARSRPRQLSGLTSRNSRCLDAPLFCFFWRYVLSIFLFSVMIVVCSAFHPSMNSLSLHAGPSTSDTFIGFCLSRVIRFALGGLQEIRSSLLLDVPDPFVPFWLTFD